MLPTLTQLYEEVNYKKLTVVLSIAGRAVEARSITYSFHVGQVPTMSFVMDNLPPAFIHEFASAQLWVGFNGTTTMSFNGEVESVSGSETGVNVQCSGQSKKLDQPFKRDLVIGGFYIVPYAVFIPNLDDAMALYPGSQEDDFYFQENQWYHVAVEGATFGGTPTGVFGFPTATEIIKGLLATATVTDFFVDVGDWAPSTSAPQTLQFQNYADAINKLAEPFGSPYMEMPTGQIRVETRDAIPAPDAFRLYFSDILQTDLTYDHPTRVTNADAQPRILQCNQEKLTRDIRNRIVVRGAEVPITPPPGDGEVVKVVLEETAVALSPWLPTIAGQDQYVELVIDNSLLDTILDVAAVAVRYLNLYNRLNEAVTLRVSGDPQIFLGATVGVINLDPFTGIDANYFVNGYTTTIDEGDFTTELELVGGRAAGTTPRLSPFALFTWTNQYMPIPAKNDYQSGNSKNNYGVGAKVIQYIPGDTGSDTGGAGEDVNGQGIDGKMQLVSFDGSPSVDPDGLIVGYAWSDDLDHVGFSKRFTVAYDPDGPSSTDMTLTVTDNDGLTSSQTERVNLTGNGPQDGFGGDGGGGGDDSTGADDSANGGATNDSVIFVAAEDGFACVLPDGSFNIINNSIGYCVCAMSNQGNVGPQDATIAFCGFSSGAIYASYDYCVTLNYTASIPGSVIGIACGDGGVVRAANDNLELYESTDFGHTFTKIGEGVDQIRGLLQYAADFHVGPDYAYATIPQVGQDAESVLFNGQDSFHLRPGSNSQYIPNNDNPDDAVDVNGADPVGVVPDGDPGAYIAVDNTGQAYSGTAPTFTAVGTTVPGSLTHAYTTAPEPGLAGVFLVGANDGVYKSIDGGKTLGLVTLAWPGGAVFQIVSATRTRFAPPGDLYAITV